MNRTVEISFFDPRAIEGEKLDVNIVVKVELIEPSFEYRVTFKDGSTKILPSTIPLDSVQIVSATMAGDDLIVHLDDDRQFNVGRIATIPTFDDVTPVGTGVLMPGSKTQFKELMATGGGLSITKTAESVKIKMLSGGGSGFASTDPGEIDFTDIYIGERFTTDLFDMGSGRTWYTDNLTGNPVDTWTNYVFNRTQLNNNINMADGVFLLTSGQYYIDFHVNLLSPATFAVRLQDLTNNVTLLHGTVVENAGTYVLFSSFTTDIIGDFIIPENIEVAVQYKWTGAEPARVICPTRVNANTGGCIGGQIFLSKIAPLAEVINSVAAKPKPTTAAIDAIRTMLSADLPFTLESLPAVGGAGLETHATVVQYTTAIAAPTGLIYLIPAGATQIACYDPVTNQVGRLGQPGNLVGTNKFGGGAVDSAGRIYLAPMDHNEFLRINPSPIDGFDRSVVLSATDENIGYDLLGPGFLATSPQLVITGPAADTSWGEISKTLTKNRSAGDGDYYRSAAIPSAEFLFQLPKPEIVKGMTLTNLVGNEITEFEVLGETDGVFTSIATASVVDQAVTNLIKSMTADSSVGQVAVGSNTYAAAEHEAFRAFTNEITVNGWVSSLTHVITPETPVWLELDLGAETAFNSFTLSNHSNTTANQVGAIKDFKLQGWNATSSTWEDLHTVTARAETAPSATTAYDYIGEYSYRKIRIFVTARHATALNQYVAIGRFELKQRMAKRLIAYNPVADAVVNAIKLVVKKGRNFINPNEINPSQSNLIVPMTADVSSGQTASASSSYDNGYLPWNAFTSSVSFGGWISSGDFTVSVDTPAWIEIDLGKKVSFNSVSIANRTFNTTANYAASPKDFTIEGWDDVGLKWDVLHTVVGKTNNTPGVVFPYERLGNFLYQKVRVKITAVNLAPSPRKYVAIGRIEIYKLYDNIILPMTADNSVGQIASASSSYQAGYLPWNAFGTEISVDGWVTPIAVPISPASPAWIALDLGSAKEFDSFSISNRAYTATTGQIGGPKDFQLQGWNEDKAKWDVLHTVINRTENTSGATNIYPRIGKYKYQKVRVYITGRNPTSSNQYVAVGRIQLFNTGSGGGKIGIDKLEFVLPGQKDTSLPFGFIEKLGASTSAVNKYRDVVYCPTSDKMLYVPLEAAAFGVLEVSSGKVLDETFGLTLTGTKKFYSGVYNPINKLIYCATGIMGFIPMIDLVNMRAKVISITRPTVPANQPMWNNAFIGVDGRVYLSPFLATEWLVICPITGAYWLENFGELADVTKQAKSVQGVYGADGRYYLSDSAANVNNIGLDTMRLTKKRLADALLNKVSNVIFSDKFGNVYFVNGLAANNLVRLNFGQSEEIHTDLFLNQLN